MIEFNNDEVNPPSWMNESFFEQVLSANECNSEIKVHKIEISPAAGKDDHYASIIFRVHVTYESKSFQEKCISLILKTMPEADCQKNETFAETSMFPIEIDMYSRIIPKFEEELRKIGDNTVLGAKMLYHSLTPRKCIMFEDLVERGYKQVRRRFVNLAEAKVAFLKLAKWHAVSYKLAAEGDIPLTIPKSGFFNTDALDSMPVMTSGIKNLVETIQDIDELKPFVDKLKAIPRDFFKKFTSSISNIETQPDPKFVCVLCHGDFHSRNVMFKNSSNGVLEDVLLVDFQVCYFGPAVLDLLYGLYMMVSEEVRMYHREELIYHYATNFIETLKRMNFRGEYPKVLDFYIDLLRARSWELTLLTSFLPVVSIVVDGSMELEEMLQTEEGFRKAYNNPAFHRELKTLLPKLN